MLSIPIYRPNPLQYFLVPDIEVENGGEDDEEDLEEEEDVDESVRYNISMYRKNNLLKVYTCANQTF